MISSRLARFMCLRAHTFAFYSWSLLGDRRELSGLWKLATILLGRKYEGGGGLMTSEKAQGIVKLLRVYLEGNVREKLKL